MSKAEWEKILYCALCVGEHMLESGAEVHRVEDTIRRICLSYGAERADVFSITSSIVVTLYLGDCETLTQTRRVYSFSNHMARLDEYNALSRRICRDLPEPEEIRKELCRINHFPPMAFPLQLFSYALVSGSFSAFFGGTVFDAVAAALIGVLLKLFENGIRSQTSNSLLVALLWSGAGGLLANIAASVFPFAGLHPDLISIGNIMLFIPGIAFTNSLRDLFLGDTITGLIRLMESLLLAVIIALGFSFSHLLFFPSAIGGSASSIAAVPVGILTAGLGTFGFSIVFNAQKNKWGWLFIGGLLSWVSYLLFLHAFQHVYLSAFLAAGLTAFYSECMARLCRTPATVFSVITTVPLIPGAGLYRAMDALMDGRIQDFQTGGMDTLLFAASMSAGIILCGLLDKFIFHGASGNR